MGRQKPTFWLLNGRTGWRTNDEKERLASHEASVGHVIRLAAFRGESEDPNIPAAQPGPLALDSPDGSLGRLTLPLGMALDGKNTVYLLVEDEPGIKRFDPEEGCFERLPEVGSDGQNAREFHEARNIAIAGSNLYVADTGNRRVQVFDLRTLVLRHVWGPWGRSGHPVAVDDRNAWQPFDVVAHAGTVYVLDRHYGRVYRHWPGTDTLVCIVDEPDAANRWTRIAVDREGSIYLLGSRALCVEWDSENRIQGVTHGRPCPDIEQGERTYERLEPPYLEGFDHAECHRLEIVRDAGDVRARFDPPPLYLDHRDRFCLPESLSRVCDRRTPASALPPEDPLGACRTKSAGGLTFDRAGNPAQIGPNEPLGPQLYETNGAWHSDALDSRIYGCQWHRIELSLADLPAGSQVIVSTYASGEEETGPPRATQAHLWETRFAITGQMPAPGTANPKGGIHDFLVQGGEGQYLWLKIELRGDGYVTPAIEAVRVHYPRDSYLKYLPAVFAADDESRGFLERFLSIFQTEWNELERRMEEIAQFFDPKAVPEGEALAYLAGWLALPLEGEWSEEQKRRLLVATRRYYSRRGTLEGLRQYLQVYLHNIADVTPEEQQGFPQIIEGFRERQRFLLSVRDFAELGDGSPLWSPAVVGRLQLDLFAKEGEVRLVSTGDPERDLFHHYAHRFRVFVPATWIRTAADECMLRRALDAEKPAHTQYDLCLVEPRFRVGVQSTVGIDTIIGAIPQARLACCHKLDEPQRPCLKTDPPPSWQPRNRLGYDTVLGGEPSAGPAIHLGPGTRVGMDTTLT